MVDTYYDKMDRGAVPRLPGYQGFVNPLAGQGGGVDFAHLVPGGGAGSAGAYGAPRARPRSSLDDYLKHTADLQKQANDANQARYDEGRRLLGLEDPNAWQKAGFASESAYRDHQALLAEQAAQTAAQSGASFGTSGSSAAGVAAAGGNITPQALASRVQAMQRGIYNSSTALNKEAVTNSLALQDAAARNQGLAMQQAQLNESIRRGDQAEADRLRSQRLEWIYNRNDQAPNLDRLQQVAATAGQGTTEGMQYPTASPVLGGSAYGGAAGGYGLPAMGGNDGGGEYPAAPQQAREKSPEQLRYEYFFGTPKSNSYQTTRDAKAKDYAMRRAQSATDAYANAASAYGLISMGGIGRTINGKPMIAGTRDYDRLFPNP